MKHLSTYVSDEVEKALRKRAYEARVTVSKFIALAILVQVKEELDKEHE